jgi:2'-5' RNA ligase
VELLRLFIAVDPDAAVQESLQRAAAELHRLSPRAKWADKTGFHLTLAFLGDMESALVPAIEAALAKVASATAPFTLRVRGGGFFGAPRKPRVLWVGVEGAVDALSALQGAVEKAMVPLGHQPEARAFSPHLTLARSRDPKGDTAFVECASRLARDFGETRVEELVLYRSELSPAGARYTALGRARLGG